MIFAVFVFGFFWGASIGLVAGTWQGEQNELEDFKKKTGELIKDYNKLYSKSIDKHE